MVVSIQKIKGRIQRRMMNAYSPKGQRQKKVFLMVIVMGMSDLDFKVFGVGTDEESPISLGFELGLGCKRGGLGWL
jgi:hypothetical protein